MYYEVAVRSKVFYGREALTYESPVAYAIGTVVRVPFGRRSALGVITAKAPKPSFKTKMISGAVGWVLPFSNLRLLQWLGEYYPSPMGAIASQFVPALPDTFSAPAVEVTTLKPLPIIKLPALTADQTAALKHIREVKNGTVMLHGETGSGKTRLYIELVKDSLAAGKSAIILVPEIGLTRQISQSFREVFGAERVVVTHSNQTVKQRREAWLRMYALSQANEPFVVIGPRSAIFAPLSTVGLIVMDESHEAAYKQEQLPHYQTTRVAAQLASLHQVPLILGSATPATGDYFLAEQRSAPIVEMKSSAKGEVIKAVNTVVDLRDHKSFSQNRFISAQLLAAIGKRLDKSEQSLIFLNRRGSARMVSCQDCGWRSVCPNCDISLVYHSDQGTVRCHTCGYSASAPMSCPVCGSVEIIFKSIGTKAVVEFLQKRFPKARIMRFDLDNSAHETLEKMYDEVAKGDADIIVGTQLITKGLDLPRLSLVGVLMADAGLSMPDFTANERTFQLLYQVLGRVGRGHTDDNEAVVQTFDPDNWVLQAALSKNWRKFYEEDLAERSKFGFPPYYYLLRIESTAVRKATAESRLDDLKDKLQREVGGIKILGPSPCFIERSAGKYRMQLVIKAKSRAKLIACINLLPNSCTYDLDPQNLL